MTLFFWSLPTATTHDHRLGQVSNGWLLGLLVFAEFKQKVCEVVWSFCEKHLRIWQPAPYWYLLDNKHSYRCPDILKRTEENTYGELRGKKDFFFYIYCSYMATFKIKILVSIKMIKAPKFLLPYNPSKTYFTQWSSLQLVKLVGVWDSHGWSVACLVATMGKSQWIIQMNLLFFIQINLLGFFFFILFCLSFYHWNEEPEQCIDFILSMLLQVPIDSKHNLEWSLLALICVINSMQN